MLQCFKIHSYTHHPYLGFKISVSCRRNLKLFGATADSRIELRTAEVELEYDLVPENKKVLSKNGRTVPQESDLKELPKAEAGII